MTTTARGARATYVYCLLRAARPPRLGTAPAGLPGLGPPRALPVDDGLWLVAADAPLDRYGGPAIERSLRDLAWVSRCATGHEAVVERAARQGTVVPLKLFTLFHGDDRAVAHVRRGRRRLDRVLARVAGRQEWGLRLLLDETRARRRAAPPTGRRAGAGAGTRFLLRKDAEHGAVRRLAAAGRREALRVFQALGRGADSAHRRATTGDPPGSRLLLDAAFLVRREAGPRFRATVRDVRRRLAGRGYTVFLTGPWPPYNFVGDRP